MSPFTLQVGDSIMKLLKQSPARLSVKKIFTNLFLSELLLLEKATP